MFNRVLPELGAGRATELEPNSQQLCDLDEPEPTAPQWEMGNC